MCHYMSNSQFIYRMFNVYIYGKLQITTLKFGDVWILHFEVSEFEFYTQTFQNLDFLLTKF